MTSKEVEKYNFKLAVMTVIFLALSYFFAKAFGPIGFVLANCANFAMRISHNCIVIHTRYNRHVDVVNPLGGILPNAGTILILSLSLVTCKASEFQLYDPNTVSMFLAHILVGGVCFVATLAQILASETFLRQ